MEKKPLQTFERRLFRAIISLVILVSLFPTDPSQVFAATISSIQQPLSPKAFSVAGLGVELINGEQQPDGSLHANRAKLSAPSALGAASIEVNDVTVRNGVVTIAGGGSFRLPRISVGGFEMQLSGSLQPGANNTQLIRASGDFKVPYLGEAVGCSGISVDVTLEADVQGRTVVMIRPKQAINPYAAYFLNHPDLPETIALANGVRLREAALKLSCKIPIGQTGFALRSVSGSVTLNPGNTIIRVGAEIATDLELLGKAAISAEGQVSINTSPFKLGLEGALKVFSFSVVNGNAEIGTNAFSATIQLNIIIGTGSVSINSWVDTKGFHFTGEGEMNFGVPKGAISPKKCRRIIFFKLCHPAIPPFSTPSARFTAQVGEFQDGQWGIKASTSLSKLKVSAYIDASGTVKFTNVSSYKLVTPVQVLAAKTASARLKNRDIKVDGLSFAAPNETPTITQTVTITDPSDVVFTLARQGEFPHLSLVKPDGTVVNSTTLPSEIEYTEGLTTEPDEPDAVATTNEYYIVSGAEAGDWQVVLTGGDPTKDEYIFELSGTVDEPSISFDPEPVDGGDTTAKTLRANQPNVHTVNWRAQAYTPDAKVAIYANDGPITETLTISNSDGTTSTVESPNYVGIELAQDLPISQQSFDIQDDQLESGQYHVWIEIDDQVNTPVRAYMPDPIVIDHSAEFSPNWSTEITTTAEYDDAKLEWTPDDNPDIDYYAVYASETPGHANPEQAEYQAVVGSDGEFDLEGLEGDTDYYVAIGAVDDPDADAPSHIARPSAPRIALSSEVQVSTLNVPLTLTTQTPTITVVAGQTANIALSLLGSNANVQDSVFLYEDCNLNDLPTSPTKIFMPVLSNMGATAQSLITHKMPMATTRLCLDTDNFAVTFSTNNLPITSTMQALTATVNVPSGLAAGNYTIPIIAEINHSFVRQDIEIAVTKP